MNKMGFVVLLLFFLSKYTFLKVLQKQAWLCEWLYRWLMWPARKNVPTPPPCISCCCKQCLNMSMILLGKMMSCCFFLVYISTDAHTKLWETWELHAVISDIEKDWVIMAQNVLVVSLRLNSIFMLGYPVAYGERALGSQFAVAWCGELSSCTPVWGVPLMAAVLKWWQEVAHNQEKGARGHVSVPCPFLTWTTAHGPLGRALGKCRQRCWAVSTVHVAWAAVPHLLRGKEALGQAESSSRLGLACRPRLGSAELAHPCCNCTENYLLVQDLYILISMVCGYNRSRSKSSFCYCFERLYL